MDDLEKKKSAAEAAALAMARAGRNRSDGKLGTVGVNSAYTTGTIKTLSREELLEKWDMEIEVLAREDAEELNALKNAQMMRHRKFGNRLAGAKTSNIDANLDEKNFGAHILDTMVELLLINPAMTVKEMSEHIGYSSTWVRAVKNSDAFKSKLAAAHKERRETITVTLMDKVTALAELAVEEMTERISRGGNTVSMAMLRDVGEMALKNLGFGNAGNGGTTVQANVMIVDREALADARARMAELRQKKTLELTKVEEVNEASANAA